MSRSHLHSFPLSTFLLNTLLILCVLTTAQAQVSTFPATSNACNNPLVYYCFGVNLCCPLPAVCIPNTSSGSVRYNCINAAGFPVDGGAGSIFGGGGFALTTTARSGRVGPIVTPTPPPVVPGGHGGSASSGGAVSKSVSLPSVPPITSVPLPVTSTARFGTSTAPVPGSTVPGSKVAGSNSNSPATPVAPSTMIVTSTRPAFSSAVQSGGGGGASGGGTGGSGGQTNKNSGGGSAGTGSGSAANGPNGNGNGNRNGTIAFTGAAVPRRVTVAGWWGGAWGSIIAAAVIAVAGAVVLE